MTPPPTRRPPRHSLPSDSGAVQAILFALADSKTPLTQAEISKRSGLQRQHVHYYMHRLVEAGVVVTVPNGDQVLYTLQVFFRDEDVLDHTYKLMENVVWILRKNVDFKEVPQETTALEEALSNNVIFFCTLFSRDVRIAVEKPK